MRQSFNLKFSLKVTHPLKSPSSCGLFAMAELLIFYDHPENEFFYASAYNYSKQRTLGRMTLLL